ncbi:hypothetical protein CDD82_554 [Ophiocordyceps australis]|uniref:Uncharacterized protein n=1 Tax=Ophiocordyceps australis TaxID=1399860 RepID=A0A2C5ZKF1_9HYPO|nr:hypothetical protein CDD82_554 [Ophiocordyceps australis]
MWTVFSRCADSVEQGRRLENLSWRLWQREQLVDPDNKSSPQVPALLAASQSTSPKEIPDRLPEVPQLSGSVDSLQDDEAVEFASVSAPLDIRPRIRRLDSSTSSRSKRDRHISSDDFEKMIVSIVQDKEPLSAPTTHTSRKLLPAPLAKLRPAMPVAQQLALPCAKVVGGFAPAAKAVDECVPEPTSSPAPKPVQPTRPPTRFALGGSCSSSEQGQSVDNTASRPVAPPCVVPEVTVVKQPVDSEQGADMGPSDPAVDSDTEAEYIDESAIDDDDDSSDWEDSVEDSNKSSVDDKFFQRVPSRVNLTSRPSLITLMLANSGRANKLGNHASQSTPAIPRARAGPGAPTNMNGPAGASPNDSDEGPLMMKINRGLVPPTALKPISEVPRSSAQPITVNANQHNQRAPQAALSPRTTRRNMLATELTESLRRHLLWERQQKSSTANAVLKRRHTSQDVANLRQFPERPCMKEHEDGGWNKYLTRDALNGYHSKGW